MAGTGRIADYPIHLVATKVAGKRRAVPAADVRVGIALHGPSDGDPLCAGGLPGSADADENRGRPSQMASIAASTANAARISAAMARPLSALDGAGLPVVTAAGDDTGLAGAGPGDPLPGAVSTREGAGCSGSGAAFVGTWIQFTMVPSL